MPPPRQRVKQFAIGLIRAYQYTLSGLLGAHCRFAPTCSQFTIEAIEECGVRRGIWLGMLRILRCHPWQKGGFDPVSAHIRHQGHQEARRRRTNTSDTKADTNSPKAPGSGT